MSLNKLARFAELEKFQNVFQHHSFDKSRDFELKGKWREKHFENDHPLILELACGKGDYTLGLATRYPLKNFIGIDIKGARIWVGAKKALGENITNVAFLRMRIEDLDMVFAENEIDEIWITFPDPFLRSRRERKRLTSPRFLDIYRKITKPGGIIHLKTDSEPLFQYSLEKVEEKNFPLIAVNTDIYAKGTPENELAIQTYYERIHLSEGKKIKYLAFRNQ